MTEPRYIRTRYRTRFSSAELPALRTPSSRKFLLRLGGMLLIIGFGLSCFLLFSQAWFYDFYTTAPTLILNLVGIFLLWKGSGAPQEIPDEPADSSTIRARIVLIVLLPVWLWLLYAKVSSVDFNQLPAEAASAHAFVRDSSCSNDVLRRLARQTPEIDSVTPPSPSPQPICTAQWMKISGKPGRCMYLEGHNKRELYCVARMGQMYQLSRWDMAVMKSGDALAAQTAFGRPSAYFLISTGFVDRIFDPTGRIVKMADNPDRKFEDHLIGSFWVFTFYLLLIAIPVVLLFFPAT